LATGEIILLNKTPLLTPSKILLPASKSESNRALIISALSPGNSSLKNLSEARDTQIMQSLLQSDLEEWDARDAGTTFRFLTAYAALTQQNKILTGTERMQKRPIGLLVEALKKVGAKITYLGESGYPPLKIQRMERQKVHELDIRGDISSQYISALMMIAPNLKQGLVINFEGKVTSLPYLKMTTSIMEIFGAIIHWEDKQVTIEPYPYHSGEFSVESDWSAASYWYSLVTLADKASIELMGLKKESHQGDQEIVEIMKKLGVKTRFNAQSVLLEKTEEISSEINLDFAHCPDLAQTIAVICAVKNVRCIMTGLESLKIKETDRILALQQELAKIGAKLIENENQWILEPSDQPINWSDPLRFESYEDHRMAMAFAPLCTHGNIRIEDPSVVNKSYPKFWKDLQSVGIKVN